MDVFLVCHRETSILREKGKNLTMLKNDQNSFFNCEFIVTI